MKGDNVKVYVYVAVVYVRSSLTVHSPLVSKFKVIGMLCILFLA